MTEQPAAPEPVGAYEHDERMSALAKLYEVDGPPDLDEVTGPTFWPDLTPAEARQEWAALAAWVDQLIERFAHLDHHVIPCCWFRHNGHVEALVALRDAERVNYGDSAPGTAAVDWHRAFQTIESRLRDWTSQLACGATHETRTRPAHPLDPGEWEQFVTDDLARRDQRVVTAALGHGGR
jgi:hypothetical protein